MNKSLIICSILVIFVIQIFPVKASEGDPATQTLAFIRGGDIWTMNSDGQNLQLITAEDQYQSIDWAPDGSLILAINNEGQIDLVDPITRDVIQIRYEGASKYLGNYTWSPDSQWIAVGFPKILIFNREGQIAYEFDHQSVGLIKWGMDSNTLYFGKEKSFYMLNITTGDTTILYTAEGFIFDGVYEIEISPDGTNIVVWAYMSEGFGYLFLFNKGVQKSINPGESGQPTGDWSPDSKQYAFQTGNIYFPTPSPVIMYNANDDTTKTIYENGGFNPRWSPDGSRVALTTWKGGLVVVDPKTGEYQNLLPDAPNKALRLYRTQGGPDAKDIGYFATLDMLPAWSPDGTQLIFTYPQSFYIVDASTGANQWYENAISPKWQTHSVVVKLPPVLDLEVSLRVDGVVELMWTDPEGIDPLMTNNISYDVRYAETPITDDNWVDATPITGELVLPTFPVGHKKLVVNTNLPRYKQLYLAIKVTDENGNETPLSNQPMYIDSGFRPTVDGYSFENGSEEWGKYPNPPANNDFTMEDTRDIFGDQIACLPPLGNVCIPDPILFFWTKVVNYGMNSGHCTGMSASSILIFQDPSHLQEIKDGADNLFKDISLTDKNARHAIAFYHVLQSANPIFDYKLRQEQVSTAMSTFTQILNGFKEEKQSVIAILNKSGLKDFAHAIVPIAISMNGTEAINIYVYDNRVPGNVGVLSINKNDNSWKFSDFSGNAETHSFYAIPLELFEGKQEFPLESYIVPIGSIDLLVSNLNKLRIGYYGGEFFNEIPGAYIITPLTSIDYAAEPYYGLPENQPYTYTITLDQGITNTYPVQSITQFGQGYAVSIETSEYSPQTSDTMFINSDGTQLTYQANESREITFTMALDEEQASTMIKIAVVDIAEDKFAINFDKSTGNLELQNGTNTQDTYNLEISYVDSSGQSQFSATSVSISPGMVQLYENIKKSDLSSITIKTDQNQDGKFEMTKTINNLSDGFNPIGRSGILSSLRFWSLIIVIGLALFAFILVRRVRK